MKLIKEVCVTRLHCTTVEPLNKGHVGTSHFVLCTEREVVFSLEVEHYVKVNMHLGRQEMSLLERSFLLCPLFRGSTVFFTDKSLKLNYYQQIRFVWKGRE